MKRLGVFIPPSPPSTPMLSCKSPAAISTDILLPAPSLLQLYHNCWQSCQHHPDLQIGEFYAWVFLNYAPFPFFYTVQSTHPCFQWEHHHPFFFQASSFQLLKLENFLRWSLFTFIYNRSLRTQTYFRLSVVSAENQWQPEIRLRSQATTTAVQTWIISYIFHSRRLYSPCLKNVGWIKDPPLIFHTCVCNFFPAPPLLRCQIYRQMYGKSEKLIERVLTKLHPSNLVNTIFCSVF